MKPADLPFGCRPFEFHATRSLTNGSKVRDNQNPKYTHIDASEDTTIWAEEIENGERAVFKLYHHRGPISWWREKKFRFRVQREFEALAHLQRSGISCTEPLYWSYGDCPGLGRSELLVTREIPDVITLHELVDTLNAGDRHEDLCGLYRLISKMHKCGLYHGALVPTNILVSPGDQGNLAFHVMDLPMAMVFRHDITGTRMASSDLLNLSMNLERKFGAAYCEPYLSEYGLSGATLQHFIHQLDGYSASRHVRNRLRAEFSAREFLANILRRDERNQDPMSLEDPPPASNSSVAGIDTPSPGNGSLSNEYNSFSISDRVKNFNLSNQH